MDKSAEAFRTIGEMAETLGVKTHILRYWEEQFPMLNPLKRAGGRRHYRPEDVALLHDINRLLNTEGYTVKGARQYLESRRRSTIAAQPDPTPNMPAPALPDSSMTALRAIRDRLAAALAAS